MKIYKIYTYICVRQNNLKLFCSLEKSGQEIIVCWTRMPMPGKEKTWTPIVKNLKELSIDTKDLSFIDQNKCIYPSLWQYDEMSFCQ